MANSPEIDFALVLARTIDSIKNDPSQLRNTVYELARTKLLMLAWEQNPRITVLELRRMMLSFETAIEHVEIHASRQDALPPLPSIANFVSLAHVLNSPERDQGDQPLFLDQRAEASEVLDNRNSSGYSYGVLRLRKRGRSWPRGAVALRAGFVSTVIVAACVIGGKYVALSGSNSPTLVNVSIGAIPKSDSQNARLVPPAQLPSARQVPSASRPLMNQPIADSGILQRIFCYAMQRGSAFDSDLNLVCSRAISAQLKTGPSENNFSVENGANAWPDTEINALLNIFVYSQMHAVNLELASSEKL